MAGSIFHLKCAASIDNVLWLLHSLVNRQKLSRVVAGAMGYTGYNVINLIQSITCSIGSIEDVHCVIRLVSSLVAASFGHIATNTLRLWPSPTIGLG